MHTLFIYPNLNSQHRIPAGPAIMIKVLHNLGHTVTLYDTTFTNEGFQAMTDVREEQKQVLKTDIRSYMGEIKQVDHRDELRKLLDTKKPDLVLMSTAAHNYKFGISLLKIIKEHGNYPTLVGGVFPTVEPEIVINNEYVDMICVGEGEEALAEVCNRLKELMPPVTGSQQFSRPPEIGNIWTKVNGVVYRGRPKLIENLDTIPYQDWSLFDKRHIWKAFVGKVWKSGGFELSRGCPQHCNFCIEDQKRVNTQGDSDWRREKSPEFIVKELKYFVDEYELELIAFGDQNFLSGSVKHARKFAELYTKEVGVPFMIQTGAETLIAEEKVS